MSDNNTPPEPPKADPTAQDFFNSLELSTSKVANGDEPAPAPAPPPETPETPETPADPPKDGPKPVDAASLIAKPTAEGDGNDDDDDSTAPSGYDDFLKNIIESDKIKNENFKELAGKHKSEKDAWDNELRKLNERIEELSGNQKPEDYDPEWKTRESEYRSKIDDLSKKVKFADLSQDAEFMEKVDISPDVASLTELFESFEGVDNISATVDKIVNSKPGPERIKLLRQISNKVEGFSDFDYRGIESAITSIDQKRSELEKAQSDVESYRKQAQTERAERMAAREAEMNRRALDAAQVYTTDFAKRAEFLPEIYGNLQLTGEVAKTFAANAVKYIAENGPTLLNDRTALSVQLSEGQMAIQERDSLAVTLRDVIKQYNDVIAQVGGTAAPGAPAGGGGGEPPKDSGGKFENAHQFFDHLERSTSQLAG